MKRAIWGSVVVFVGILTVVLILTMTGRSVRATETDHALAESIDTTLSNVMQNTYYSAAESDKFIADFMAALLVQVDSESDIKVSVLEADPQKGIMSMEVTEAYTHPNGKRGTVSAVRTVIFDRTEPKAPPVYTVSYFLPDSTPYKKYSLVKDSTVPFPVPPKEEGKTFDGWAYQTGGSGTAASVEDASSGNAKQVLSNGDGTPLRLAEDISLIAVFH